jgi:hypothetical protein
VSYAAGGAFMSIGLQRRRGQSQSFGMSSTAPV